MKKECLNIDYLKVKGFEKLSPKAQQLFQHIDRNHTACVRDKAAWTPVKVKERKDHLEVHFKNGEWLHYSPNGSWY